MSKPFDLEKAKALEPIEFRNGFKCTFISHSVKANPDQQLIVLGENGRVYLRCSDGRLDSSQVDDADIVMTTKLVKKFVNFYPNLADKTIGSYVMFDDVVIADTCAKSKRLNNKAIEVMVEE